MVNWMFASHIQLLTHIASSKSLAANALFPSAFKASAIARSVYQLVVLSMSTEHVVGFNVLHILCTYSRSF